MVLYGLQAGHQHGKLRWEAAAFAAGCPHWGMVLGSRCNFRLQREVFPIKKIEKQSIANGSFMLLNSVIYEGNATGLEIRDAVLIQASLS